MSETKDQHPPTPDEIAAIRARRTELNAEHQRLSAADEALLRPYERNGHISFANVPVEIQKQDTELCRQIEAIAHELNEQERAHFDTLLAAVEQQAATIRTLREALGGLLADIQEYQTINNLGGDNNHWQVQALAALAASADAQETKE